MSTKIISNNSFNNSSSSISNNNNKKNQRPKSSSTTIISEFKETTLKKTRPVLKNNVRIKSGYSDTAGTNSNTYSIDRLVNDILEGKITNILCVVGAGISTPSGIPDFRTPGTGLYDNLKQFKIPYPEAIFDLEYFNFNPKPFFTLAKEIMPSIKYKPNKIHYFLRLLQEKQLLQRLYTQNIDGLERLAGICADKIVEAHGTFSSAKCLGCRTLYSEAYIRKHVDSNQIPYCKKSDCSDVVKPNIVFFGENLPKRFDLHSKDFSRTDLVIIMGTSLEVEPFAGVIKTSSINTPRLLINREAVGPFKKPKRRTDLKILGDLVQCLDELVEKLGWKTELEELMERELDKLDYDFQQMMQIRRTESVQEKRQNENETPIVNSKPPRPKTNHETKKLTELNNDLSRTEQLSGLYYLKDNYSLNTHEILSRRHDQQHQQHQHQQQHQIKKQQQQQQQQQITDDLKNKIIQQNNGVLGLTRANIENQLNKKKVIENYRFKNNNSDLSVKSQQSSNINNENIHSSTSNIIDPFLPPNFKQFLNKRGKFNQSPFSIAATTTTTTTTKTQIFTQEVKISSKFYANSKPLLNASLLSNNTKVPKFNIKSKNKNNNSSSSESESTSTESDC